MFFVFGFNLSIGLFVVLSVFLLDRHYFFDILLNVDKRRQLRVFNAGDVLLDLSLLTDVNVNFWSWLGKDYSCWFDC